MSSDGEYAYTECIEMWQGFIKNFEIEEVTDTKTLKDVAQIDQGDYSPFK